MKIKRVIDFVKRNAKMLLLIYIAVTVSVVAVKQVRISKQGTVVEWIKVLLEGQDVGRDVTLQVFKGINDLKGSVNLLTKTNIILLIEIYKNTEKDEVKQRKFIEKLIKIMEEMEERSTNIKEPAKELTEAQKMGKKMGKDTVEMMKAMEEEIHKAGYPF